MGDNQVIAYMSHVAIDLSDPPPPFSEMGDTIDKQQLKSPPPYSSIAAKMGQNANESQAVQPVIQPRRRIDPHWSEDPVFVSDLLFFILFALFIHFITPFFS